MKQSKMENKIWHTNKDLPINEDEDMIFYTIDGDRFIGYYYEGLFRPFEDTELKPDKITKYAYIDDLIASSKALEVAIRALKEIIKGVV